MRRRAKAYRKAASHTSGEALALGIKSTPTMIKPNLEEARQFLGEVGVEDMTQRELSDHILAMGVLAHYGNRRHLQFVRQPNYR